MEAMLLYCIQTAVPHSQCWGALLTNTNIVAFLSRDKN